MADDATIVCQRLSRYYGATRGVEDLDLEIRRGEIFGFLGPNGAGKTTTIRILLGLLKPTRGSAAILGLDTWSQSTAAKLHLGSIAGDVHLYDNLKVKDLIDYIDAFRPGPDVLRQEMIERMGLDTGKKVKALSRGNRQKVAIVLATMHDPEILLLDEPTSGLDPLMQQEFYTILGEFKERGKTVFLSSHILSEVERVCDRVGIVREGCLVDVRAIEELRRNKIRHMDVIFAGPVDTGEFEQIPGVLSVQHLDSRVRITIKGEIDALVKQVARHRIDDMTFTQPGLEDFFLSFYGTAGGND